MQVELFNRQRAIAVDIVRLEAIAKEAAVKCASHTGRCGSAVLGQLEKVDVSVVSDRVIARIHRQFLKMAGPTDVITFDHGEIFISATTAARQAIAEGETADREMARYIVHGLLHLSGHLDEDATDATSMWKAQELVLQEIWPTLQSEVNDQAWPRKGSLEDIRSRAGSE